MGMASPFQYNGTEIAGSPVMFCVRVNATNDSASRIDFPGSSGDGLKDPSAVGGTCMVGESRMSHPPSRYQQATFREKRCSSSHVTR